MIKANTFKTQAELIGWLRRNAAPMIDENGTALPDTGIARIRLAKSMIDMLLNGGAQGRDTGKDTVYNFIREGKRYTLKVESTWNATKECVFTWDHRNGKLADAANESESVDNPQFEIILRMVSNRIFVQRGTWKTIYKKKNGPRVTAWEINRRVNGQLQMIAQSYNYHSVSAATAMRRSGQAAPEQQVIDGLLVDTQWERTYIYFTDKIGPFDSCLKIYNGTHMSIEGSVTLDNYEGFLKAAALSKTFLHPVG